MNKILKNDEIEKIVIKIKKSGKKIVLVGGCFDILHPGHIFFLEQASQYGDVLFVLLESDENINKRKGSNRPINSQKNRAVVLSALSSVDFILPLRGVTKDQEYDRLILQINPNVIAITRGDKNIKKRKLQCKRIEAMLVQIEKFEGISSTSFIKNIN